MLTETRKTIIKHAQRKCPSGMTSMETLPLQRERHELTARAECLQLWRILVMRREKGGSSKETMGSSGCKTFFCSLSYPKHKPALKSGTRDGSFWNISFFLGLVFIPDIFKMCFNLEKDKTETLQESKWSLKPRALHINNVVSWGGEGEKKTQTQNKTPKPWTFSYFQAESRGHHMLYLSMNILYRLLELISPGILALIVWKSKCATIADSGCRGGSRNVLMI